ncbi:unnamed protein product [Paramecium primaurelia]|uniref:Uncharacterized protein n=1 Tax=Paramecium primaurelia TaxID=5886 RepID=A0A8S1Q8T1_PARPR|nr:unnamed protein product [Paramecium primaurelia]
MDYQLPSLAEPFTWVSYSILGILVGLSQAGGIGGGPIISPVMMVLLGCPSKKAIWNTYIMLLGGSLGNFLRLGKERTANGSAPLINYQLVQITLPLLLAGAILGVATGKWLPKLMIVIFLFGILMTVFLKTKSLYIKTRSKEMNEQLIPVELKELTIQKESNHSKELNIIREKDARLYPIEPLTEISLTILIIIVVTLLKGSGAVPSLLGIDYCGYGYHFLNFIIFGIAFYNVQRYRKLISKEEEYKESIGYDFADGKMSAVFDITVKSSLYAGFLGGLVGLGGGVVLTPLWLETGINPPRAAASATFTVLFTSSISVFIIALSGGYQFSEFIILGLVSSFGSYMVAGFLKKLVKKYKRESILIQVLLGVISFGLIILPFQSIKDVYQNPLGAIQFGRLC